MTVLYIVFLCALALTMLQYDSKLKHDRWLAQRPEPKTGFQGNPRATNESYTNEVLP